MKLLISMMLTGIVIASPAAIAAVSDADFAQLQQVLLAWNPWQHVFLRGVDALHTMSGWRYPMRC